MADNSNPFMSFFKGQDQARQWAIDKVNVDLQMQQAQQREEEFLQNKLLFQMKVGEHRLNQIDRIMAGDPTDEYIKELIKQYQASSVREGDPVSAETLASFKDPKLRTQYAQLMEMVTEIKPKDPEAFQQIALGALRLNRDKNIPAMLTEAINFAKSKLQGEQAIKLEQVKQSNKPPVQTEEQKTVGRELGKSFAKEVTASLGTDKALEKVDNTFQKLEEFSKNTKYGTGPIATLYGAKQWFSEDAQNLETLFKDLRIDDMTKRFQGMAKAIDSDAEQKAFNAQAASLTKDDKVNARILLGLKSFLLKEKAHTDAKKAWFASGKSLASFTDDNSPVLSGQSTTMMDPNGKMVLVKKSNMPDLEKNGFKTIDQFVDSNWDEIRGKSPKKAQAQSGPPVITDQMRVSAEQGKKILEQAIQANSPAVPKLRQRLLKQFPDPQVRKVLGIE